MGVPMSVAVGMEKLHHSHNLFARSKTFRQSQAFVFGSPNHIHQIAKWTKFKDKKQTVYRLICLKKSNHQRMSQSAETFFFHHGLLCLLVLDQSFFTVLLDGHM